MTVMVTLVSTLSSWRVHLMNGPMPQLCPIAPPTHEMVISMLLTFRQLSNVTFECGIDILKKRIYKDYMVSIETYVSVILERFYILLRPNFLLHSCHLCRTTSKCQQFLIYFLTQIMYCSFGRDL